jgi:hypothetical protein
VDKKVDLNVYKDLGQDEESSSCCSTGDSKPEREVSTCCSTTIPRQESGGQTSFCCTTAKVNGEKEANQKADIEGVESIDFNEWASKLQHYIKCSLMFKLLTANRFL